MKAFVIAMENEAQCVLDNLTDSSETREFGRRVVRGRLCGEETMVVISGIGKVNASAATQFALQTGADTIVNIGVAGGLDPSFEVADIFEIDSAVQYDFDLSAVNGTMVGTLDERSTPYIPLSTTGKLTAKSIGTGDRFNDSDADNDLLANVMSCSLRDMECAAVAQVCERAGARCVAFKCVSDVRGKGAMTGQYVDNLKRCLARLAAEVPTLFSYV
ncbi:MAG: 5'-methylthioadenosine/S-adenosylhomocysteine nucleosidase [Kiritimatiellae bacterium]|nr:5'-methylthioadenosine/S-adenosylhomocysteine nucleosidase [Kiritimatiellia bacterium]MBQ7233993.1 5'-methylthioadenosine/S-adenosylhomocysteine nucleosidase [Kiritimatiellia bacterium]